MDLAPGVTGWIYSIGNLKEHVEYSIGSPWGKGLGARAHKILENPI